jgi:hypothetical protein
LYFQCCNCSFYNVKELKAVNLAAHTKLITFFAYENLFFRHNIISNLINDYYNKRSDLAALIFSSVFFCDKYNINVKPNEKLKIFRNYIRNKTPFPSGTRSKTIILRPKMIETLGTHLVWGYKRNNPELNKPIR